MADCHLPQRRCSVGGGDAAAQVEATFSNRSAEGIVEPGAVDSLIIGGPERVSFGPGVREHHR